jgi:hypothetical protein
MNPLLWLSPVSATICWISAYMFRDDSILKYGFAGLGALPIVESIVAYFLYFLLDRDRHFSPKNLSLRSVRYS